MYLSRPVWFMNYPAKKMVPKCKTSMKIIKGGGRQEIECRPAITSLKKSTS